VYNPIVLKPRNLPDLNRLSVLAAAILLAYALARFIDIPPRSIEIEFLGVYLPFELNTYTLVAFLVAGLTATGADWLLRDHPQLRQKYPVEHWLLPALTAWVIGLPLFQLPLGLSWWLGFFLGAILLMLVLVAEYITVDPNDLRHPIAAAGLTALSFSLFLMLAIAIRFAGWRLVLTLPALTLASYLVSLRTLHLRLKGVWAFVQAGLIAWISAQIIAALHYLPISPLTFGFILIAPVYALTSLMANLMEDVPVRRAVIEPALIFTLLLFTAVLFRE
jgi:hypothetical protein